MSFHSSSRLFVPIFLHIVRTSGLVNPILQNYQVLMPDKAAEYLKPFENCTTMIFTAKNFAWSSLNRPTTGPIALLEYKGFSQWGIDNRIVRKFALQRRRNHVKHCWATFGILPVDIFLTIVLSFMYLALWMPIGLFNISFG